jgi:hypothetical protein
MPTSIGRASPTKPPRRTKREIEALKGTIQEVVESDKPMTVRQVFYRLVAAGVIGKTENEYQQTVCRFLGLMRRSGELPFEWVADNTRWMRKPRTYRSLDAFLNLTSQTYRRALWHDQDVYVELWLEKDALSGVLFDVTAEWDIPLMVTRGYPSITFLHAAAEAIADVGKPCHLYYFGDHDPSGVDIPRKVETDLRRFAPHAEIHFSRVAVTAEQITELQLPTRPTKKSDSRSRGFDGESVEVDAIPPQTLREMATSCITRHVDWDVLSKTERIEDAEKETLRSVIDALSDDDNQGRT